MRTANLFTHTVKQYEDGEATPRKCRSRKQRGYWNIDRPRSTNECVAGYMPVFTMFTKVVHVIGSSPSLRRFPKSRTSFDANTLRPSKSSCDMNCRGQGCSDRRSCYQSLVLKLRTRNVTMSREVVLILRPWTSCCKKVWRRHDFVRSTHDGRKRIEMSL